VVYVPSMPQVLYRLAHVCIRHRFLVLGVWVLLTAALVVTSHRLGDNTNDNLSLPGTDSQLATDTLARSFPDQANGTSPIVLHAAHGKLTEAPYAQAVDEAAANVAKAPNVASVVNPLTPQGASALSKDMATGYLSVTLAVPPGELSVDEAQRIVDAAAPAKAAGLDVETGGQLGQKVSKPSTESSEVIGILAAMVILTLAFGTVVAMLLPIVSAILALLTTLAVIRLLGHVTTVPTVAPTLATMIGLGVGIDYALFIVTRHFRDIGDGLPVDVSIARAAATSGGAVFFAGGTVTIALLSLAVAGIPLVTTMGLMAGVAVVVAVLAALTLLPAALATVGPRIDALRVRARPPASAAERGAWARWARGVAGHPLIGGLVGLAVLIPLSIPLLSLTLGQQDVAAFPTSTTVRRAYDLLSESFGPGINGPLLIAVSLASPAKAPPSPQGAQPSPQGAQPSPQGAPSGSQGAPSGADPRGGDPRLQALERNVASTDGVAATTPIVLDGKGTTAYFNAIAKTGPAETATATLVEELRSNAIPSAERGTDMQAHVGGSTAGYVDLAARISEKLPLQIAVVIALSFVLLIVAFRAVVIPAQAAVMNLLSIAASYGVLTAVFQYGWLSGLAGLEGPVPVVSYVPLFMFAILFGLSMDYEVFLVSQIEEHVSSGEDNRSSVVSGLVTSARVITAAALIMVFVFGSFVLDGDPTIKQFGVGLAVAVILDATVVRCLLVPAVMVAMGRANWWMPGWLDRALPHVSIEAKEFLRPYRPVAGADTRPARAGER
jgi:putative drug exporter of the RND superfamily